MSTLDITTPEGMKAAVRWQENHMRIFREGATWVAPAAQAIIQLFHSRKTAHFKTGGEGAIYIVMVFQEMGWTCLDPKGEVISTVQPTDEQSFTA